MNNYMHHQKSVLTTGQESYAAGGPVRVELREDLQTGGSAEAYMLNSDVHDLIPGDEFSPGTIIVRIHDTFRRNSGVGRGQNPGTRFYVEWWPDFERWEIIGGNAGVTIARFELTEELFLAETATAELIAWNGATLNYDKTGDEITVADMTREPGKFSGQIGYRGFAVYAPDRDVYEILMMERLARHITFTLTQEIASGESPSATVNDYWDGKDPGTTVTIYDPQGIWEQAPTGARGKACWDDIEDKYKIVEMQSVRRWTAYMNEKFGDTTANEASCDLQFMDGTPVPNKTGVNAVTVIDYLAAFGDVPQGTVISVFEQWDKYYIDQAPCP